MGRDGCVNGGGETVFQSLENFLIDFPIVGKVRVTLFQESGEGDTTKDTKHAKGLRCDGAVLRRR